MNSGMTLNIDIAERVELFRQALGFEDLNDIQLKEIACLAFEKRFCKGQFIFHQNDPCDFFHVVAQGLVKVSICSSSGIRITYLLAERGEPLNLVGLFTGLPRFLSAEAFEDSTVMHVKRADFIAFALKNPTLIINIISILGRAIDSANSRVVDMMEKRVEQRLHRVLYTLYKKFGSTLRFTSHELAELAGTTTESTLRAMARLRQLGIVRSGRGEIIIIEPTKLTDLGSETLWLWAINLKNRFFYIYMTAIIDKLIFSFRIAGNTSPWKTISQKEYLWSSQWLKIQGYPSESKEIYTDSTKPWIFGH